MSVLLQQLSKQILPNRSFFYWLVVVFNRVSKKRIREVGPDVACAEWLIRNGAAVKWGNAKNYSNDFNNIAAIINNNQKLSIHGVDATDSAISHEGFPYFDECKYINDIKLVNCIYIGNEALFKLEYLKNSLRNLEISNCANVTDEGLDNLKQLTNLQELKMENLPSVKNKSKVISNLHESLPECKIISDKI